jgi:RNA 2',3'-cyclic 3'-phosphodiesterase
LRLFTAIDIPPDVKAALAALLDRHRSLAKLHWIPVEKLHITTKFIGEWPDKPETRLDELKQALASVKAPAPVDIVIRGLGRLPRVLYAAVEPNEALTALAAATELALGVPAENRADNRVYRPHITLARTRKRVPHVDLELSTIGSFRASSFALYLSAAGKYTKLQEFSLDI